MPNEKLEKLKHEQYVAERKLTAAKHKEKRLESEIKRLTRSERTHRLCTRAGMLETFLREPTVLTDDDVMELLTFIFHSEAVQKKLNMLIENRKETEQPKDGDCVLPKAPCRELDDFRKSPLLQSSRGSYTSPALSCDSYPFVDLPPMNDCKQSFTVSKFIFSPRPC